MYCNDESATRWILAAPCQAVTTCVGWKGLNRHTEVELYLIDPNVAVYARKYMSQLD